MMFEQFYMFDMMALRKPTVVTVFHLYLLLYVVKWFRKMYSMFCLVYVFIYNGLLLSFFF